VKFDGAFCDVELAGDLFVGKVLEERVENFLFAAAEIGDGIGFQAACLSGKDGVHETGENGAGHPETATGDERESADQLVASFGVGEDALYAETEQRKAGRVLMLVADHDEAGVGVAFENIGEQSAGGLAGGVGVHDIDLGFGRFESTEVGSESGLELLGYDFEFGLRQKTFKLAQHERMRREEANRQFGARTFSSHFG